VKVSEFQRLIADLYLEKDRRRGDQTTFLWLMEEMGELSVAVRDADKAALREELADVIAWTASLANLHGIDLEEALAAKYPGVCVRCRAKPCACPEKRSSASG